LGNTATASTIADFCWAALHCVQDITIGIGEGVYQGVGNTLHMLAHPIETVKSMAHGTAHILGILLYNAVEQAEIEWAIRCGDFDAAESKINSANERFKRVDAAIREKLAELSLRDVSREITSFGTELYLQGKMLSTVGDFFTYAQEQIPKLAEAANLLQDERALLSTAEGMSVHIAGEAISSAQAEQMLLQNMNKPAKAEIILQTEKITTGSIRQKLKENKKLLEYLDKKINNLAETVSKRPPGKKITVETHYLKIEKIEAEAEKFYNLMRKTTEDIAAIAKNTGISKDVISKIKNHIFLEEHILRDRVSKFFADADMAAAWERLINNNYIYADLKMLQHEYAEAILMNGTELSYDSVHYIINEIYNWEYTL